MVSQRSSRTLSGYPVLNNIHDLNLETRLSPWLLYKLSKNNDSYYRVFHIKKSNGGDREIAEPARNMKAVQAWINVNILQPILLLPQVTGFRKGNNILQNARAHEDNRYLLCLDIDDFFPSIKYPIIYYIYQKLGYNSHMSHVLTSLCTFRNRLPQGGVTSPTLSNLACYRLDRRIIGYCGPRGITYTRYADDMTFSTMSWHKLIGTIKFVEFVVKDEGFNLNKAKTRYMGPKRRQKVTGMIIGNNKAGIGRQTERVFRASLYNLFAQKTSPNTEKVVTSIQGYLSFLYSVDTIRYNRAIKYISSLTVKFHKSKLGQRFKVIHA